MNNETEQFKRVKEFMNEAIEAYDKGDLKETIGKLIWCIGWLADEIQYNKENKKGE